MTGGAPHPGDAAPSMRESRRTSQIRGAICGDTSRRPKHKARYKNGLVPASEDSQSETRAKVISGVRPPEIGPV